MLNIYISVDIEGINGVVYPHQTIISGEESYFLARKQLHREVNCIIEALNEVKVDKITINDAHYTMENLTISDLSPQVELITGKPKPVSMLAGLDESYSCVFFVGYHAKAAAPKGVLAHTFSPIFNDVRLNGASIGEIELNSVYMGQYDIPLALVTGDDVTCKEVLDTVGEVRTVATKTAISTTSALCRPNDELLAELRQTVIDTVKNPQDWILYRKNPPYTLELDLKDRKLADLAELLPNVQRTAPTGIMFNSDDYQQGYKLLQYLSATLPAYYASFR